MSKALKIYSSLLIFILIMVGGGWLAAKQLQSRLSLAFKDIANSLSESIGHPVIIDKVTSTWTVFALQLKIDNLSVLDSATQIPLFMADSITARVSLLESVLKLKPVLKSINIDSPRVVVDINENHELTVIGLGGEYVPGRIDPEDIIKILESAKVVSISNADFHLQGPNGADLALMNLKLDASRLRDMAYKFIISGKVVGPSPPEFTLAFNYLGDLRQPREALIDYELKTTGLQTKELMRFLQAAPKGLDFRFEDLDLNGAIQRGTVTSLGVKFYADDMRLSDDMVNVKNLAGEARYLARTGLCKLELRNFQVSAEQVMNKALHIDNFAANLRLNHSSDGYELSANDILVKTNGMQFNSAANVLFQAEQLKHINVDAKVRNSNAKAIWALLPDKVLAKGLIDWLHDSITAAKVTELNYQYYPGSNAFKLRTEDVTLRYSKEWPTIDAINATVLIKNSTVQINADKASILGQSLGGVRANYPVISSESSELLEVSGSVNSTLDKGLEFIEKSGLKDSLGTKLKTLDPTGAMRLNLNLLFDLGETDNATKVNSKLIITDAKLEFPDFKIPISKINGELNFTEQSISGSKIDLELFGNKATASLSSASSIDSKLLDLKLATVINIADIKEHFAELQDLNISGQSPANIKLSIPWETNNMEQVLSLDSSLEGITIDYPEPFAKDSSHKQELSMQVNMYANEPDVMSVTLADWLSAKFKVQDRKIIAGVMAVNQSQLPDFQDNSLELRAKLDKLDPSLWQEYIEQKQTSGLKTNLELEVANLQYENFSLANTLIKHSLGSNNYYIANDLISGNISVFGKNKLEFNLDNLELSDSTVNGAKLITMIREAKSRNELPIIQFDCDNLYYANKLFKNVSLNMLPRDYGYEINELSVNNPAVQLSLAGQWQMTESESTQLSGNLYSNNIGLALSDWGYENNVNRGNGELSFSLAWDSDPMSFELDNLRGDIKVDIRAGSLTQVNPGLGRIVGLLTLESIQRRLKLDFSDLVTKGFAFDNLSSDIRITPGVAESDNIVINGPAARILLTGSANLQTEELDFIMSVTPKVGVGIPLAAAIAVGNPAVGAAIWLFDKASGSRISEITRYQYRVNGSWAAPKIEPISRNNKGGSDEN